MTKTDALSKTGGSKDEIIRAQLRKGNLKHDAEIKMLIALLQANGISAKYDEKNDEVVLSETSSSKPAANPVVQQSEVSTPSPSTSRPTYTIGPIRLNEKNICEAMKPYVTKVIREVLQDNPVEVKASVDSTVHLENNDLVLHIFETKLGELVEKMMNEVSSYLANEERKPASQNATLVSEFGDDKCYKVDNPDTDIPMQSTDSPKRLRMPGLIKHFFQHIWDDMVAYWWKMLVYEVSVCCLLFGLFQWYQKCKTEDAARKYDIIKPLLQQDQHYAPFINAL